VTGPDNFYARLPPITSAGAALDERLYAPAPADWFVAFSDIRGSTAAVAAGRHSDVNFCAAAMIAALSNELGAIPYQFGGDGAVALVPPGDGARARKILARARASPSAATSLCPAASMPSSAAMRWRFLKTR